jgi:hypothetical protein
MEMSDVHNLFAADVCMYAVELHNVNGHFCTLPEGRTRLETAIVESLRRKEALVQLWNEPLRFSFSLATI